MSYRDGIYTLVQYSTQVRGYQIPVLANPDQWPGGKDAYQKTLEIWANTTGKLQSWTYSTLQNLIATPDQLINSSTQVILPRLNASIGLTEILIRNPTDADARKGLMDMLAGTNLYFGMYSSQIQSLIQSLNDQSKVFDANADVMNKLAADALKTAGNEQQLIVKLNDRIAALNSDITAAALAIAGGSFVAVLGIGMGILGIVLAPFTGGVSLTLLIPAAVITAGGAAIIALNSIKIKQDKDAIEEANKQISKASGDITLLNAMATTLKGFAGQTGTLKTALAVIVAPWNEASTYLTNTIREIDAIEHATTDDWLKVCDELTSVRNGWNVMIDEMKQLRADADVAPGSKLTLGMSESEVRYNMNSSVKVTAVQYLTHAA